MHTPFDHALREFDRVNGQDPRMRTLNGASHPRELIFAQRVSHWIAQLSPDASEAVRLAARSHTLRRWDIPRTQYPMDTAGYHEWRATTAAHSARSAAVVLRHFGYSDEMVRRVRQLIRRELFPHDPDAQLLEDADCLAFLELKLVDYLDRWDEEKVARILHGTWAKMSQGARSLAAGLPLDPRAMALINMLAPS
jgi:hypothetical protein